MVRATISKEQANKQNTECIIHTLYGDYDIHESVILDLLASPYMLRLKKINQYGINNFLNKPYPFTRYDHSLGVLVLLRKFGASLQEQIAGLLHDVSHTVFSHVGDYLFPQNSIHESYQDAIHSWFLMQTDFGPILTRNGFSIDEVLHKSGCFLMLETDLPDICADRLEYNLYGGFIENMLDLSMINEILNAIFFANNVWYFDSLKHARKFADVPLRLAEEHFATPWNVLQYKWAAQALNQAVSINLITVNDIHFSTDDIVWQKLCASDDAAIKEYLAKLTLCKDIYTIVNKNNCDEHITAKFRGIDPWVKIDGKLQRLSAIDTDFSVDFNRIKDEVSAGWYVKYK